MGVPSFGMMLMHVFSIFYIAYVTATSELQLRKDLFNESRYSPSIIPRISSTDSVMITMKWQIIRLGELSAKESRLTQSVVVSMKWQDEYLTWDPSLYGGTTSFVSTGKEVWTPHVNIFNSLYSDMLSNGFLNEKINVMSNGTMLAYVPGLLDTICDVDPEHFPADCHKCNVLIGISLASTRQFIVWDNSEPITFLGDAKTSHPLWKINSIEMPPMYPPTVMLTYTIERRPEYYIYNIVVPASALAFLTILNFFIPIEEGERVGFSVTVFLSFMVLMLQVNDLLPENSKKQSAVGQFFLQLTATSLIVIFNSVVMAHTSGNQTSAEKDNSVHPAEDSNVSESKDLPFIEDEKLTQPSDIHTKKTNTWVGNKRAKPFLISYLQKFRKPLRIFDLITFLSCIITCMYAHIALFQTINSGHC